MGSTITAFSDETLGQLDEQVPDFLNRRMSRAFDEELDWHPTPIGRKALRWHWLNLPDEFCAINESEQWSQQAQVYLAVRTFGMAAGGDDAAIDIDEMRERIQRLIDAHEDRDLTDFEKGKVRGYRNTISILVAEG
ncbi:hypothetical protein GCM10028857_03020 [Salinarchaeum chitinilyticum]